MLAAAAVSLLGLLPHLPVPQRFPAEVQDAYAVEVNPAGLTWVHDHELRVVYGYQDASNIQSHGFGVFGALKLGSFLTVGANYAFDRYSDDVLDEYRFGVGFGGPHLSFGFSWGGKERLDETHVKRWDLGSSWRPWKWLALGLTAKNIGREAGERVLDGSIALRPWASLVVSGRTLIEDTKGSFRDRSLLELRSEWEVVDGLLVGLGVNDDGRVFGQVNLEAGYTGLGLFGSANANDTTQIGGELVWRATAVDELIPPGRVAVLNVYGDLVPSPQLVLLKGKMRVPAWGQLVAMLDELPTIRGLKGVFLRIGSVTAGWAHTQEVRQAIARVRQAGVRVDCYLTGHNDVAYYLASACQQIAVPPPALLQVDGIATSRLYFGDALSQLGLRFEVNRVGAYKNSPDRYTRSDMSEEERSQLTAYISDIYNNMSMSIASGRSLSPSRVEALIAEGTLTATVAKAEGLVDHVLYPEEMERYIRGVYRGHRLSSAAELLQRPEYPLAWTQPPRLAVVHIDAPITAGDSRALPLGLGRTVGAETLIQTLRGLRHDDRVVAVVLRVNSPGGDALASDLLAREVAQLSAVKPVVASFGDIAASGGYYVSAPTRRIFAEPSTLTGSIGIYSVKLDASQLLLKLGIGSEIVSKGELAANNSSYRMRSPKGVEAARRGIHALYRRFVQVVAAGRSLTVDAVDTVGRGRIFSGRAAVEAQLVDEMGGMHEAMTYAAREGGRTLESVKVVHYPDPYQRIGNPLQALMGSMARSIRRISATKADASDSLLRMIARGSRFGSMAQTMLALWPLLVTEQPLALCPVNLDVE